MNKYFKNSKGFGVTEVILILLVLVVISSIVIYMNRDKFPTIINLTSFFDPMKIESPLELLEEINNSSKETTEPVKEIKDFKSIAKKIEELDKEYFDLLTFEKLTSNDAESVKSVVKKIRQNNEEHKNLLNSTDIDSYSSCNIFRTKEVLLRDVEQIYILKKPSSYQKEIFEDSFTRKRLDTEKDYQLYCKSTYEKIGAKIIEF